MGKNAQAILQTNISKLTSEFYPTSKQKCGEVAKLKRPERKKEKEHSRYRKEP